MLLMTSLGIYIRYGSTPHFRAPHPSHTEKKDRVMGSLIRLGVGRVGKGFSNFVGHFLLALPEHFFPKYIS